MIQFWELSQLDKTTLAKIMRRAETDITSLLPVIQEIINQVRQRGDAAIVHRDAA